MRYAVLIHSRRHYIVRIYVWGHEANLAAFEEEVADDFPDICRHYDDDPEACKLVGDARCLWLRFTPSRYARITKDGPGQAVTMIRVHRNNTPGRRTDEQTSEPTEP